VDVYGFMQCFKHVAEDRTNETHIVPVQPIAVG